MAKQQVAAIMTVITCDFPGCRADFEVFYEDEGMRGTDKPDGWTQVLLSGNASDEEADWFSLCPSHAQHAETVKLVHAMLKRGNQINGSG